MTCLSAISLSFLHLSIRLSLSVSLCFPIFSICRCFISLFCTVSLLYDQVEPSLLLLFFLLFLSTHPHCDPPLHRLYCIHSFSLFPYSVLSVHPSSTSLSLSVPLSSHSLTLTHTHPPLHHFHPATHFPLPLSLSPAPSLLSLALRAAPSPLCRPLRSFLPRSPAPLTFPLSPHSSPVIGPLLSPITLSPRVIPSTCN